MSHVKHPRTLRPAPPIRKAPPRAREKSFAEEVVEELKKLRDELDENWQYESVQRRGVVMSIATVLRIDRRRKRREGRKGK